MTTPTLDARPAAAWGAVVSMSLGVFGIVGAEFLPASLLTTMAGDLGVTEGMAGQAVTVTAVVAVLSSLLAPSVTGRFDRRPVLIVFTVLLIASNLLVAAAPSLGLVLLARVLLGVALGGFWALSAATMMRLVPEDAVPRALAILFAGVSGATVFAAPFGSFFGDLYGWRAVFLAAAGVGALALVTQVVWLPAMRSGAPVRLGALVDVFRRPGVALGMLAFLLIFSGHFGFFTYLRPFLEQVSLAGPTAVTVTLLIFGAGTFVGTSVSSFMIDRSMRATLAAMPLLLAVLAVLLALAGGNLIGDAVITGLWGFAFGIVPVSWSTWVTRAMPEEAETGGGLLVATANLAIAIGAAGGGLIFDLQGSRAVFAACAGVLSLAFLLVLATRPAGGTIESTQP